MNRFIVAALALLLGLTMRASAHEVRPAYLELREITPGVFEVLWKTPMLGEARLALTPQFGDDARPLSSVTTVLRPGAAIQTWTLHAPALRGGTVRIEALESTMTDALVRVDFADGGSWTARLTPRQPMAEIPTRPSDASVAGVYLRLGVEHILTGPDHLLFVLALLILTRGRWMLVKTITAFTLAHTVTLALATLGYVHVPQSPVEAIIALSIVLVAAEILRERQGRASLASRAPWIVALSFGLLHGLGFAGGLSEIGLPAGRIPLALGFFSVGVEAGNLLFVGVILGLGALGRAMKLRVPIWVRLAPTYAIGAIASFWVIQRVVGF